MIFKSKTKKIISMSLFLALIGAGSVYATNERAEIPQIDTVNSYISEKVLTSSRYDTTKYKIIEGKPNQYSNSDWSTVSAYLLDFVDRYGAKYSANHIDRATAVDGEGNDGTPHNRNVGSGGNVRIALAYLTSGKGPIDEEEKGGVSYKLDDYQKFLPVYKKKIRNANPEKEGEYDVGKYPYFNLVWDGNGTIYTGGEVENNREAIKQHILNYGAVSAKMYKDPAYYINTYKSGTRTVSWYVHKPDDHGFTAHGSYSVYSKMPGGLFYYCPDDGKTPNHNVVILGWDDDYDNNVSGAPNKGAWIVGDPEAVYATGGTSGYMIFDSFLKEYYIEPLISSNREELKNRINNLGSDKKQALLYGNVSWFYDRDVSSDKIDKLLDENSHNFYYVSYDDAYIESEVYGIGNLSLKNYDYIYQHDPLGMSTTTTGVMKTQGYSGTTMMNEMYGANVFGRVSENPEKLVAVSVASEIPQKYEIYVNPYGTSKKEVKEQLTEENLIKVAETDYLCAGYHTINLEKPVYITGEGFAVVVKYIADASNSNWQYQFARMGVEAAKEVVYKQGENGEIVREVKETDPAWQNATAEANQSYTSMDLKEWTDLDEVSETKGMNLCIKAFVKDAAGYVQPVEELNFDKEEMEIVKGDEDDLTLTYKPEIVEEPNIIWRSSNTKVLKVDQTGHITAVSGGTAIVTATAALSGVEAQIKVNVVVPVEGMELNQKQITVTKDQTYVLGAIISPQDATNQNVIWTSNNTDVCRVTSTGVVIGMQAGRATITGELKDKDGNTLKDSTGKALRRTCSVVVPETIITEVTGVTLNKTELTMEQDTRETLVATITPEDAAIKDVQWTSSNKAIAIVSVDGRVTALTPGDVTIKVTTLNGGKEAECKIKVIPPRIVNVSGVSLKSTALNIETGKSQKIEATVMPANATNKEVTWTSSDRKIANVTQDGTVTGGRLGVATITATTKDGQKVSTCIVNVTQPYVEVTDIELVKTADTIIVGNEYQIEANVLPYTATVKTLKWETDKEDIAEVDQNGKITAKAVGEARITVQSTDSGVKKVFVARVIGEAVKQNASSYKIVNSKGQEINLTQKMQIKQTKEKILKITDIKSQSNEDLSIDDVEVKWESSNEEVAIVENGRIVTLGVGEAIIKVTVGGLEKQFTVKVVEVSAGEVVVSSNTYNIQDKEETGKQVNIIDGVGPKTIVDAFITGITITGEATVKVVDMENNEVSATSNVGTGMKIIITPAEEGAQPIEYEIIVKGDMIRKQVAENGTVTYEAGDGIVTTEDLAMARDISMGKENLTGYEKYLEAIDFNKNGRIDAADIANIKDLIKKG